MEIFDNITKYGLLTVDIHDEISEEKEKLIKIYAKQIADTLSKEEYIINKENILIVHERSIIARELHDSIAQSLSCLKMQISHLKMQPDLLL